MYLYFLTAKCSLKHSAVFIKHKLKTLYISELPVLPPLWVECHGTVRRISLQRFLRNKIQINRSQWNPGRHNVTVVCMFSLVYIKICMKTLACSIKFYSVNGAVRSDCNTLALSFQAWRRNLFARDTLRSTSRAMFSLSALGRGLTISVDMEAHL